MSCRLVDLVTARQVQGLNEFGEQSERLEIENITKLWAFSGAANEILQFWAAGYPVTKHSNDEVVGHVNKVRFDFGPLVKHRLALQFRLLYTKNCDGKYNRGEYSNF